MWTLIVLVVLCSDSTMSTSDKLFSVTGTVHKARGLDAGGEDVYCKVRLEQ